MLKHSQFVESKKTNNQMFLLGFLTLPTAYVTGNPVECVVHPDLWNKTQIWDPLGIGLVDRLYTITQF